MGGFTPEAAQNGAIERFNDAMRQAQRASDAVAAQPDRFQAQYAARERQNEVPDGFSLDKISSDVQNQIRKFGATLSNETVNGKSEVKFAVPSGSPVTINGQKSTGGDIYFDANTVSLRVYGLKQDGFNNPNAPLRIECRNRDGSVDTLVVEKAEPAQNAPIEIGETAEARAVDDFMKNYSGDPKGLFDTPANKKNFDALVNNWMSVSDTTVAKTKDLVRSYARQNGMELPANFTLTAVTTKDGHPGFKLENWATVYNSKGEKPAPQAAEKPRPGLERVKHLIKPGETPTPIELSDGRSIHLLENKTEEGLRDGNYGYRAIILDGKRYDVTPGTVSRMRDGGTTNSTFSANGETYRLHEPTPFKRQPPSLQKV